MPTLLNQANRTGRIESAGQAVAANATGRVVVTSDIRASDLANPAKFYRMSIEIQDATLPGGWRFSSGALFQCGPAELRDGTVVPGGVNGQFAFDVAELAGKTIRGVLEIFDGNPDAGGVFGSMRIGLTYTIA